MTKPDQTPEELVIGLVAPIGTDLESTCMAISDALESVGYAPVVIRLSSLLPQLRPDPEDKDIDWPDMKVSGEFERYDSLMRAGNAVRKKLKRGDALAMLGIGMIRKVRRDGDIALKRAFILRSLKHPSEIASLRRIYGPAFLVISVYSPPNVRAAYLADKITDSIHQFLSRTAMPDAWKLILRDESESDATYGQNVRKTFPLGDFFLNASSSEQLKISISRMIELLFGNVFHTPSKDEYAMFLAHSAAVRSSSLQRQVGAVITNAKGDLIATGANEVPRGNGGHYWPSDRPDCRDFQQKKEANDVFKKRMLADVLSKLKDQGLLKEELKGIEVLELLKRLTSSEGVLSEAQMMNVIEFGRCVHAEMSALMDAARLGLSVDKGIIYSTTFPCHECARHIVAAGIRRVVYIQPYPKSLVNDLFSDSIQIDGERESDEKVNFEPFVGVGPRRYLDLFSTGEIDRRDKMGKIREWDRKVATPRLGEYSFRTHKINFWVEMSEFDFFRVVFKDAKFEEASE